jgi:hypothetical protein
VLATEPSFLVLKIEPVFEDSGEAGEPHLDGTNVVTTQRLQALRLVAVRPCCLVSRRASSAALVKLNIVAISSSDDIG